jgi:hypothetical protein
LVETQIEEIYDDEMNKKVGTQQPENAEAKSKAY